MLESISWSDRWFPDSWSMNIEELLRKVLYGKKPGLVFWGHIVCLQGLCCGPWPALYWGKSTDSRKSGWISLDDRELREQKSNRNPTSCVCKGTIYRLISSSNPMLLTLLNLGLDLLRKLLDSLTPTSALDHWPSWWCHCESLNHCRLLPKRHRYKPRSDANPVPGGTGCLCLGKQV